MSTSTLQCNESALDVVPLSVLGKVLHGEQDFRFHRPIRPAVRVSKPVLPGQDIHTRVRRTDATTYAFETDVDGAVVLRDGVAELEGV